MKPSKTILAIVATICSFSGLYAGTHRSAQKKHYITDESIFALEDGLIIETSKGPALVKKLHSDKQGVFFSAKDIIRAPKKTYVEKRRDKPKYYYCLKCDPPMRFDNYQELRIHMAEEDHRRW
jgi:hypothetical protein